MRQAKTLNCEVAYKCIDFTLRALFVLSYYFPPLRPSGQGLAKWLVAEQPITLAVNEAATGEARPFSVAKELFENTCQVGFPFGSRPIRGPLLALAFLFDAIHGAFDPFALS
jgi:hypothetical protein